MSILKGLVAGTTTAVRNRLADQKTERDAGFSLLEQTTKENIEALKLKKTAVTRYDNVLLKVAQDMVKDNVIDPLTNEPVSEKVAYDMAYDLDQNFLNQTNDNGYATTNYKDLLNVYKQSNLNGNSLYVLNKGELERNLEPEPEPEEIPGDDRNMFQKIFKNDPNYAAEQVARKYGITPGEATAFGGSQENALNMYGIADVYKGDQRRFSGRDLSGSGVAYLTASNIFAKNVELQTTKFKTYFSPDSQGRIFISEAAPEWFAIAMNAGTSVIGSVADNSGTNKVMVGPTVAYAGEVSEILIDYQELQDGLSILGKDIQTKYKFLLNPPKVADRTATTNYKTLREDIVKKLDIGIEKNEVTKRVKTRILDAYDKSLIDGDEFTELSTLEIDTQNVLKNIKKLKFTKYALNQARERGVEETEVETEVEPEVETEVEPEKVETEVGPEKVVPFTEEQLESERNIKINQAQDLMNKVFDTENFNEVASSMENNPFLEDFNVSPIEESSNDSAEDPTIRSVVSSAVDSAAATSRIKTIARNVKVQINQNKIERARELITEAVSLGNNIKGISGMEEYSTIMGYAKQLGELE